MGGTYCRYNIIENGNQHIRLYQTSGTAGNNNQLQNIYIAQGVNNTTTYVDISTIARNLSYRTTVARLSDGTIRIYREDEDDKNVQADWNQTNTSADDYIKNKPDIPTTIAGLTGDVNISSPTDGQILRYNNTSSKWENADYILSLTNQEIDAICTTTEPTMETFVTSNNETFLTSDNLTFTTIQ